MAMAMQVEQIQDGPIWNEQDYEELELIVNKDTNIYLDKEVIIPAMEYMGIEEEESCLCKLRINGSYCGIELNDGRNGWITDSAHFMYHKSVGRFFDYSGSEAVTEIHVGNSEQELEGVSISDDSMEAKTCKCLFIGDCDCEFDFGYCKCSIMCHCEEEELVIDRSMQGTYVGIIPQPEGTHALKRTPQFYFTNGEPKHGYIDKVTHRVSGRHLGYFIYFVCRGASFKDPFGKDEGEENNQLLCKKGSVAMCGFQEYFV